MLLLAMSVKLVAEISLMAMLGQVVLGGLAGARREANVFWRLLDSICLPPRALIRRWGGRHWTRGQQDAVAAALVAGFWLGATVAKVALCLRLGVAECH